MEVHDIVQEAVIKTICKKGNVKRQNGCLRELYSSREKRTERQGKRGKYTQLNAEFQRIKKREKKAFLSEQCKEMQENNLIGKTRDLFKKIGNTKGTFHVKITQ